eukprot:590834-Prymnesium_polylepis.2
MRARPHPPTSRSPAAAVCTQSLGPAERPDAYPPPPACAQDRAAGPAADERAQPQDRRGARGLLWLPRGPANTGGGRRRAIAAGCAGSDGP